MNIQHYNNLFSFISNQIYPLNISESQQKSLQNQSKHYFIESNLLYKRDRKFQIKNIRVVRKWELEPVLYMFHNDPTATHASKERMMDKMKV